MTFFGTKPDGFSKSAVHKVGRNLREGEPFNEEVFDAFMEHQARMCDEVSRTVQDAMDSLIAPYNSQQEPVRPNSGAYFLSARPKTTTTLVEKLRRMPKTPLENILDVAGARIDCDMTLREQSELAEIIKKNLLHAGVDKVNESDLRDTPHSGYRAFHLHIFSSAGKAELQIRTPLQAQWANLYEVAADIYGRDIRYLEFGAEIDPRAQDEVEKLHQLSAMVARLETAEDALTSPFSGGRPPARSGIAADIRELKHTVYGILSDTEARLIEARARKTSKGAGAQCPRS
ncbi:hypothetical protein [Corynebacterium sp. MSK008]|uniref:hypothetical protein n=1 Tax=Corynebacterium sp. MSK008 TaxID=3050188 RepID=UPI0025514655|nr:hypothetical protein [Corynebacterium sp. MSK008]MDK8878282.1 hypothetical protein [Corynebacterium sp. MSK008]